HPDDARLGADELERVDREEQPREQDREAAADERVHEPLDREVPAARPVERDDAACVRISGPAPAAVVARSATAVASRICQPPVPRTATSAAPIRIPTATPIIIRIACFPRRPRSAPSAITAAIGAKNGCP